MVDGGDDDNDDSGLQPPEADNERTPSAAMAGGACNGESRYCMMPPGCYSRNCARARSVCVGNSDEATTAKGGSFGPR